MTDENNEDKKFTFFDIKPKSKPKKDFEEKDDSFTYFENKPSHEDNPNISDEKPSFAYFKINETPKLSANLERSDRFKTQDIKNNISDEKSSFIYFDIKPTTKPFYEHNLNMEKKDTFKTIDVQNIISNRESKIDWDDIFNSMNNKNSEQKLNSDDNNNALQLEKTKKKPISNSYPDNLSADINKKQKQDFQQEINKLENSKIVTNNNVIDVKEPIIKESKKIVVKEYAEEPFTSEKVETSLPKYAKINFTSRPQPIPTELKESKNINKSSKIYDVFVIHNGQYKWDFVNYNLDTGEYLSFEQKIEICKDYFLNQIIPDLIEKKIISQGDVPKFDKVHDNGYGGFLNSIGKGIYPLKFNDLLKYSSLKINRDPNRYRFLDYDSEGLPFSKEQQITVIGSYFNDVIIPLLIERNIIESAQDFKYNYDKDFLSFIYACNERGFKLEDVIQASKMNITYKKTLIKKLISFLDSRIDLIKNFSFLPTPENIIEIDPLFNKISFVYAPINKWIRKHFDNLNGLFDYKKLYNIHNFKKNFNFYLNILLNTFSDSKNLENDIKAMFNDLLNSLSNSNNELEKIRLLCNILNRYNDPKHLALVLFYLKYEDINFFKKPAPILFEIQRVRFIKIKRVIFNQLRNQEKYFFIFKFCPLEWLNPSKYFIVLKDYLKLCKTIYPQINVDFILNLLVKNPTIFEDRFVVTNFSVVLSLIYLRYFCNEFIDLFPFVDNLNKCRGFLLNPNTIFRYFNFISNKYFKSQDDNYKDQTLIIRSLFHQGRMYYYQVFIDRFDSGNLLHNILLNYLRHISNKINLPSKFFDPNFRASASNLFIKGSRKEILSYKKDFTSLLKKIKIHNKNFHLCKSVQSVYNFYLKSNFESIPHHPEIYDELIENYNNIVATEVPVWLTNKNGECFYTGHIDLIKLTSDSIIILDYKRNDYELFRSLPQIALYGLMVFERLKSFYDKFDFNIICITFSNHYAFEFSPNIFKDIPDFIRSINSKRKKSLYTKNNEKELLEEVLKIIDVLN